MKQKLYGFWISLFLLAFIESKAQDSLVTFIADLPETSDFIAIDGLNNIYLLNSQNHLLKYTPEGKKLADYNDLYLNATTLVAAENPFKTILYHPDQGKIIVLDNKLVVTQEFNIYDLGFIDIAAIAVAQDNQSIWIFDKALMKFLKIDQTGKKTLEVDLNNILKNEQYKNNNTPRLIETDAGLFLIGFYASIAMFDNFGNYSRSLPYFGKTTDIQAIDDYLVLYQYGHITMFNIRTFETKDVPIDIETDKIIVGKGLLVSRLNRKLSIYKF